MTLGDQGTVSRNYPSILDRINRSNYKEAHLSLVASVLSLPPVTAASTPQGLQDAKQSGGGLEFCLALLSKIRGNDMAPRSR